MAYIFPSINPLSGIKKQLPNCKLFWMQNYLSSSYHVSEHSLSLTVGGLAVAAQECAE